MTALARFITTAIAISMGVVVILGYFFDYFTQFSQLILGWAAIVVAFALLLGILNLFKVHASKITNRQTGWPYSLVLILSLALTLIIGRDGPNSIGAKNIFDYVLRPLEATLFALLAFFLASAAYRAFRIKNFETFLLVAFTIVVLLGQVPAGFQLWADLPLIKDWIIRVPALAGARGILLGVALGTIATGLRVLLGADRPYVDVE